MNKIEKEYMEKQFAKAVKACEAVAKKRPYVKEMTDKQVKWCAVRSMYSTQFSVTQVEQAKCKKVFVERGKKSFASYDKAVEDAERLTKERNCAQWEFSRLVTEFRNKASILANDQTFFPHGLHSDTKESIYAAIHMLQVLADNMVAAELSERLSK